MKINNKYKYLLATAFLVLLAIATFVVCRTSLFQSDQESDIYSYTGETLLLPPPDTVGDHSLEEIILERRSQRSFSNQSISIEELSQVLWAAQGVTDSDRQLRAAPSAGAMYPFQVFVCVINVNNMDAGIYLYEPINHQLLVVKQGDFSKEIFNASLSQESLLEASIIILLAADYSITRERYGDRTEKYVHMEAGHIGQNILLQVTALNLGAVPIGAFEEKNIQEVFQIAERLTPIYLFPIGTIE